MTRRVLRLVAGAACIAALAACRSDRRMAAQQAGIVDSAIPREVALARFQASAKRVDSLTGGLPSRDSLIASFVRALERRDTTALRSMLLTRDEFAFLYYPTSAQGLPPYDLSPQLMWFMMEVNSAKGLARALEERGGRSLHYAGYRCYGSSTREGENTLWGPCTILRVQPQGDTVEERLFGQVIERGGRWKFGTYANKL
ncbi:MAG: hypothetical protein ACOY71_12200 [Gemmatimonadota bacterium]